MFKKTAGLLLSILLIISQVGCTSSEPVSKTDFYLNTTCTIEIRGMAEDEASEIIDNAFAECGRYEGLFSRTLENTDISKVNNANGQKVTVSPETAGLIMQGLTLAEETDGLFDITVGQLTDLWNFSAAEPKVPADDKIKETLPTIGYEGVHLHETTVQLDDGETWLDLGAIAKGYIADRLVEFLEDQGVTCGIVNLGGNIVTIGTKEDGSKWNIGLEAPYSDRQEMIGGIEMEDMTVVTSGTYERYIEKDGKKYHHILDPETGYPVDSDIISVSISSKKGNSGLCDGYSTVCLLLGREKAEEFMKDKDGFEYCIVDTKGKIYQSENFNLQQ